MFFQKGFFMAGELIKNEAEIRSDIREIFSDSNTVEVVQRKAHEYAEMMAYYRCAIMEVETKFNVLNEEFSLQYDRNPIEMVKTRLKSPASIRTKLERYGFDMSLDSIRKNIHDIAGVRVICSFINDVYILADALLKQDDITLISKKDYIKNPKKNGYRSLHLIVSVPIFLAHEKRMIKVEIQLRTLAMDFWASLEHQLRYKKNFAVTEDMLRELHECAEMSAELDGRMEALRKVLRASLDKYDIPG